MFDRQVFNGLGDAVAIQIRVESAAGSSLELSV